MADQIEELRASFNGFDSNNDGRIQLDEFSALLKNLKAEMSAEEVKLGFVELDTDKDGVISFEEFVAWWGES